MADLFKLARELKARKEAEALTADKPKFDFSKLGSQNKDSKTVIPEDDTPLNVSAVGYNTETGELKLPSADVQLEHSVDAKATEAEIEEGRKQALLAMYGVEDDRFSSGAANNVLPNTDIQEIDEYANSSFKKAPELKPKQAPNVNAPSRENILLNDQQELAITTAIENPYSNLVGYAGTGKTTTVLKLVRKLIDTGEIRKVGALPAQERDSLDHLNHTFESFNFAMCAFTGLSVKTLRRVVPNEFKLNCATIHKLVDFGPVEREVQVKIDGKLGWTKRIFFEPRKHNGKWIDENGFLCHDPENNRASMIEDANLLPFDQIIIDECSMLGIRLWQMLINALPTYCKIVTIGDLAQLPPVMDKPIQPLLLAQWPTTELTQIYRQKDGDMISNANAIRAGKKPVPSEDFRLLKLAKEENTAQKQVLSFINKEYMEGRYDPVQDILITPTNIGLLGQEMMNILTRNFTNRQADIKVVSTTRGKKKYAVGDRVMNVKNDNNIDIYNGMLGWITAIVPQAGVRAKGAGAQAVEDISDQVEFDIMGELNAMEAQQKKLKQLRKVNAMFGGGVALTDVNDASEEEEGTRERKSSHVVHVQFDYEVEDDPDGQKHMHYLNTSAQLENLILSWWITIHKSQGSGFRNVYIVLHNSAAKMLCNELMYTAITRCIEKVTILSTNYAFNKCLTQMKIKGATLEEKIASYAAEVDLSSYPSLYIPSNNDYTARIKEV